MCERRPVRLLMLYMCNVSWAFFVDRHTGFVKPHPICVMMRRLSLLEPTLGYVLPLPVNMPHIWLFASYIYHLDIFLLCPLLGHGP